MPTFATISFPFVLLSLLFASSSFSMINTDVSSRMVFTGASCLPSLYYRSLWSRGCYHTPKMILLRRWRQSFLTGFPVYRPTGLHLVSPLVRQCFLQSTNVVRCFFFVMMKMPLQFYSYDSADFVDDMNQDVFTRVQECVSVYLFVLFFLGSFKSLLSFPIFSIFLVQHLNYPSQTKLTSPKLCLLSK